MKSPQYRPDSAEFEWDADRREAALLHEVLREITKDLKHLVNDVSLGDLPKIDLPLAPAWGRSDPADVARQTVLVAERPDPDDDPRHDEEAPGGSPIRQWIEYGRAISQARGVIEGLRSRARATGRFIKEKVLPTFTYVLGQESSLKSEHLMRYADAWESRLGARRTGRAANPYFWCADHAQKLDLQPSSLDHLPDDVAEDIARLLKGPRGSRRDFLEQLVEVCGCNRHVLVDGRWQPCPAEKLLAWRTCLATSAMNLLGAPCREGDESVPQTREACADYRTEWSNDTDRTTVTSRPLIVTYDEGHGRSEDKRVCKGILRMPRIRKAVTRLRDWSGEKSADGQPNNDRLMHIVDWLPSAIRTDDDGTEWRKHPDCLLLVRLLCELHTSAIESSDYTTATQNVRIWAMINHLCLEASAVPCARAIPIASRTLGSLKPEESLEILWRGLGSNKIQVGRFLTPKTCDARIMTAIEDVDWRLWLIDTYTTDDLRSAMAKFGMPEGQHARLRHWLHEAGHADWEPLKHDLLARDESNAIERGARHCAIARMKLSRSPPPNHDPWHRVFMGLIGDLDHLEKALLARLHELDPTHLGNLMPPREQSGAIDVFRWRANRTAENPSIDHWTATWRKDDRAFGSMISEEITADGTFLATFSASSTVSDDDLRLLNLPFVTIVPSHGSDDFFKSEGPFDRFALSLLRTDSRASGQPDIGKALVTLHGDLATGDHRHFDALVKAATSATPTPHAVQWLEALRDDSRFRFECHPAIEKTSAGFMIRPTTEKDNLAWEDSDAPDRSDLRVTYAIEKKLSKRVLSRGRPLEGSAEALAARLEELCVGRHDALRARASEIRKLSDAVRTFPTYRERYVQRLMERLCGALDEVVSLSATCVDEATDNLSLAESFLLLSQLANRYDHTISPSRWSPQAGTPAVELRASDQLSVFFHPTVPSGDVIVDRFDVSGIHARAGKFRRSAGPSPAGYDRLRDLEAMLPNHQPHCRELHQALDAYPLHVLEGKYRLAVQGIYDMAWKAILDASVSDEQVTGWKTALADLIRKPFDMVMFEPSSVGDYPVGWTVGRDGKAPFGRHIARVVRPGVRTLEKKLIWPAVVEME